MNKLNIFIKSLESIDLSDEVNKEVIYSLSITTFQDLLGINFEKLHTHSVYAASNFNFSVHLQLSANNSDEVLNESLLKNKHLLAQLAFHPKFKRIGNNPVFFVTIDSENRNEFQEFLSWFKPFMLAQGFEGIEFLFVDNSGKTNESIPLIRYTDTASFQKQFKFFLKQNLWAVFFIGLINESQAKICEIIEEKKSIEQSFKEEDPDKYFFLENQVVLTEEVIQLRNQLKSATEDLVNQKKYLNIIREEDEANKINNFYYTEYEILPLWYKKFGHILKALMGKRSFRSLFDNNVKKYKE